MLKRGSITGIVISLLLGVSGFGAPFIATLSQDGRWVVASFTRNTGNVWSNPELTCQHVDPQAALSPGEEAILETKLLVVRGSLDDVFARAMRQRDSLVR